MIKKLLGLYCPVLVGFMVVASGSVACGVGKSDSGDSSDHLSHSGHLSHLSSSDHSSQAGSGEILVTKGWVRWVPPVSRATAVYLTLENSSADVETLVSVSSPIAKTGEIHQVTYENGVMTMGHMSSVHMPAGEFVKLAPGKNHIMLIGLQKPLHEGQLVEVNLGFSNAMAKTVKLPVLKTAP